MKVKHDQVREVRTGADGLKPRQAMTRTSGEGRFCGDRSIALVVEQTLSAVDGHPSTDTRNKFVLLARPFSDAAENTWTFHELLLTLHRIN